MKIIVNAVECQTCKRVLVSVHRHDFRSCGHVFNDGGRDYFRRGHYEGHEMVDKSIVLDEKTQHLMTPKTFSELYDNEKA